MPFQRYIVVFKKTASKGDIQKWKDEITKGSGTITHEYGTVLNGFAAEIPPENIRPFDPECQGRRPSPVY